MKLSLSRKPLPDASQRDSVWVGVNGPVGFDELLLEADRRRAIGEGKLTAAFQPIYDLEPMRLAGFEALARWEHPTREPIDPAMFIALAEDSGHIEEVTRWMIDHAVSHLGHWHREWDNAGR